MARRKPWTPEHRLVELDGTRYVILRERDFVRLCDEAGAPTPQPPDDAASGAAGLDLDRDAVAERLAKRRRAAGLSQSELARRAGIRPETLNRIERGRATPDFATIRKLVVALQTAEIAGLSGQRAAGAPDQPDQESRHALEK